MFKEECSISNFEQINKAFFEMNMNYKSKNNLKRLYLMFSVMCFYLLLLVINNLLFTYFFIDVYYLLLLVEISIFIGMSIICIKILKHAKYLITDILGNKILIIKVAFFILNSIFITILGLSHLSVNLIRIFLEGERIIILKNMICDISLFVLLVIGITYFFYVLLRHSFYLFCSSENILNKKTYKITAFKGIRLSILMVMSFLQISYLGLCGLLLKEFLICLNKVV